MNTMTYFLAVFAGTLSSAESHLYVTCNRRTSEAGRRRRTIHAVTHKLLFFEDIFFEVLEAEVHGAKPFSRWMRTPVRSPVRFAGGEPA